MDQRPIPRRLSATDSLMWRIEIDPTLRSPILVVGLEFRHDALRRFEQRAGVAAQQRARGVQ